MASVFNRLMIGRPSELEAFINAKASRTNDDTVRASLEDTTQYPISYHPTYLHSRQTSHIVITYVLQHGEPSESDHLCPAHPYRDFPVHGPDH
jgi:hypothetical protein